MSKQEKMGCLLRELRKEKGLTQEQLAELFNVSNRTVSRWENGTNAPDFPMLLEIADYFEINILELIEGERKKEMMIENQDDLKKIVGYAEEQKNILIKKIHYTDLIGLISMLLSFAAVQMYLKFSYEVLLFFYPVFMGIAVGMIISNINNTIGAYNVLNKYVKKHKWIMYLLFITGLILIVLLCGSLMNYIN